MGNSSTETLPTNMGVNPDEIGVHSIRKGAATYCTSGTTAGVNFVAVCVRAGWSMGFKDTYLQYSEAGDQLCGRTVAGLDVNSHLFAISPPFFCVETTNKNTENEEGNVVSDEEVDEGIEMVFGNVRPDRRLLCRFLTASLLYHRNWLRENKESGNRLFGSVVFRDSALLEKLKGCVQVCLPWTNHEESLWRISFTGISPVVRSFCYQQEQLELVTKLPTDVVGKLRGLLDNLGIGGGNISVDDLKEMLLEPISKKIDTLSKQGISTIDEEEREVKRAAKFATLPANYTFNRALSTLAVWLNWHHGEIVDARKGLRSPPWKALESRDLARKGTSKERNTARKSLSNVRLLCGAFDQAASFGQTSRPTEEELSRIFHEKNSSISALLHSLGTTKKGRTRRVEECHWETLAKAYAKKRSKKNTEGSEPGIGENDDPKKKNGKRKAPPKEEKKATKTRKSKRKKIPSSKAAASGGLRGSFESAFQHTRAFPVSGPNPRQPNVGRAIIKPPDYKLVMQQGLMMTGFVTTAYLSRLSREHYKLGVRRVEEDFWDIANQNRKNVGRENFWKIHISQLNKRGLGSNFIDWDNDPVIMFQIFLGPLEGGHWTLLICDRTRSTAGVMVFFDSLPTYERDIFEKLQTFFQDTSLVKEGTKWIRVTMRNQHPGSNDCGMWMCCSASAYVKALKERGWLVEGENKQRVPEINSVTMLYPKTQRMDEIGIRGRTHMVCTYQDNKCSLENPFFNFVRIWFN